MERNRVPDSSAPIDECPEDLEDVEDSEAVGDSEALPAKLRGTRSRIMYLEDKSGGLQGPARIGRVYFSKTGRTLYYRDLKFRSLKGSGFKANYYEVGSGSRWWISGPRRDRDDRLYGGNRGVEVDADVREEYEAWLRGS